jgi:AcrR family transcriptional regulator
MPQVKKGEIKDRILLAAHRVFRQKSYQEATISDIADAAKVTPSNIYNYYRSKFDLFYDVYANYIIARLNALSDEVSRIGGARAKVQRILEVLWQELPNDADGLSRNLIQAIVTTSKGEPKPHFLLEWCEDLVHKLLREAVPKERQDRVQDSSLAFLIWMAFDGFSANAGMGEDRDMSRMIDSFCTLLLD